MSIQAVAWALELDIPDMGAKLVLVSLANHADLKTGECFPTIETLTKEASASASTVRRKIATLTTWGLVEKAEAFTPEGRQRANTYRLRTDRQAPDLGGGCQIDSLGEGVTCDPLEGVTRDRGEGVTGDRPLKETIIKNHHNNQAAAPIVDDGIPDFEELLDAYSPRDPRDVARTARPEFEKLSADDKRAAVEAAGRVARKCQDRGSIPYMIAYLRDRLWLQAGSGGAPVACEFVIPGSPRWQELAGKIVPPAKMHLTYVEKLGREAFVYYPGRKYA